MMATKAQAEHTREVEYIALADLMTRLHPQNAKGHNIGGIIEAYKEHGYVELGTIDDRTGYFLAGHGRTQALTMMKKQKMDAPDGIRNGSSDWLVPVNVGYSSKDDIHALAYLAASNKLTIDGGWNEPMLAELLQEVANDVSVALESTGFSGDELDDLLRDLDIQDDPPDDPGAQVDRAAELNETWQVKHGDVWEIPSSSGDGVHRIMCGDSTSAEDVGLLMGGVKADAVVTDPPYGVSYADKNSFLNAIDKGNSIQSQIKNDNLSKEQTQDLWQKAFGCMYSIMSPGAVVYCFMPQGGDQMMMMMMMMMKAGIEPRHELIWLKNNHVLGRVDYAYKHEPILYAWKAGGHKFYGEFQTSILEFDRPHSSKLHPTMKPVELICKLISNSSLVSQIVYDPFLGSGTTLVACEQTGRVGYGMEISESYCAVALQRLSDMGLTPQRSERSK